MNTDARRVQLVCFDVHESLICLADCGYLAYLSAISTLLQMTTSPYADTVENQEIVVLDSFQLESGVVLDQVPVAYKTWGSLNSTCSNAIIICHAISGSSDAEKWWSSLFGPGMPFDPAVHFIFCGNVLGSPYGTASPCTIDPKTGKPYGPSFPLATIRDDVRLHKLVLDRLGVTSVMFAIGGSMGGMQVLEWAFFPNFVKNIVPIATSGRTSAWCIAWGEAQRQAIFCDLKYAGGHYDYNDPPTAGLAAARMVALLTYRSRNSFETRFGRSSNQKYTSSAADNSTVLLSSKESSFSVSPAEVAHNEGTQVTYSRVAKAANTNSDIFAAQSYLRYQGDKFNARFDANCYIALTRKLDAHDISRNRQSFASALASLTQTALIIGTKPTNLCMDSDGLFTSDDQYDLGNGMPNANVVILESGEGHDGFLLEVEQMRDLLGDFIKKHSAV